MISYNTEYSNVFNGEVVTAVAYNEIKPNDKMIQMINKNHPNRVQPLVEFIDTMGNWHILSLEDFENLFKEIE